MRPFRPRLTFALSLQGSPPQPRCADISGWTVSVGGCLRGRAVRVGRGGLHPDAWKLLTLESDLTLLSQRTVLLRGVHRAWSLSLRMGCVQEIPLSLRWRVELAGRGDRKHLGDIRFPEDVLLKVYF